MINFKNDQEISNYKEILNILIDEDDDDKARDLYIELFGPSEIELIEFKSVVDDPFYVWNKLPGVIKKYQKIDKTFVDKAWLNFIKK